MMRLVLALKPMKGIEEKLLKSGDQKLDQKYLWKSWKWKALQLKIKDDLTQTHGCIDWCKSKVYKVWKPLKHPSTLSKIGEISHFSPLFSKIWSTLTPDKIKS
jgi:hypothetical protein